MVKKYGEYITESSNLDKRLLKACGESGGNKDKVEELLNNGANIKTRNGFGNTPLMSASSRGNWFIVELLLDRGADIDAKDNEGWTPLIMASRNGKTEVVKLLLEYGADKEAKDNEGWTPLIFASWNGHTKIVKLLLEYGADINVYNDVNKSCLDYKCKGIWKQKYTQELIITGQPINIKFFDDEIGILPSLKVKYKEVIEMSELGIFG